MGFTFGDVSIDGPVPLPAGAATAARQAAPGTAGTPSSDVASVQGIVGGVPLSVAIVSGGSGSGPVTANQGTANSFANAWTVIPTVDGVNAAGTALHPLRFDPIGTTPQPMTVSSLPLPVGAAVAAKQAAPGSAGFPSTDVVSVQGIVGMVAFKVDGSATTQPVSVAALPLPMGAATSAKQPAIGTSGTPSSDVLTVQGKSGMTSLLVDGSAVIQPSKISDGTNTVSVKGAGAAANGSDAALVVTFSPYSVGIPITQMSGAVQLPAALGQTTMANSLPVVIASDQSAINVNVVSGGGGGSGGTVTQGAGGLSAWKVDGSAVTQPISATSLPLPSGAATSAKQPALGTAGTASSDVLTVQGKAGMISLLVDGTATVQPVSVSSLPLPSGAATSAKQAALGIAGTASTDVVTIQGIASMVALKVDGSAVTQPVSLAATVAIAGTVTQGTAGTSAWKVDGSSVTQPISIASTVAVSATALPLPAGASTSAKQPALGVAGTPSSDVLTVQGTALMTALKVDGSAATQPVSIAATVAVSATTLPLPAGAATAAKQPALGTAGTASVDVLTIQGKSGMVAVVVDGSAVTQPVSIASTITVAGTATVAQGAAGVSAWKVDGSGVTQPVSISSTVGVSAVALPLPTGASTSAKQPALGVAGTASTDVLTIQGIASMVALKVDGSAVTQPISGAVSQGTAGASAWKVDGSSVTQPVSITSLPLPTGAATAAKQPALGVAGTASADVLTIQGKAGMTAVVVDGSTVTQPISIASTVAISAVALPLPSGASTAAKQPALGVAGTPSTDVLTVQGAASMTALKVDGSAVTQPVSISSTVTITGTVTQGTAGSSAWKVDGSAVTQPVSAVSLPLPTGAATSAKQPALGIAGTASADIITVQGISSMTALKVDGSGVTQPVSISGTVATSVASLPLPAGAATAAKQPALGTAGTASADVITVQGKAGMTALLVDGSAVTQPISATQLPSALISGRLDVNAGTWLGSTAPSVGSKTSVNSIPVVIASDQAAIAITGSITATNPSVGTTGSAAPASSTLIGASDGTNLQALRSTTTTPAGTEQGLITRPIPSGIYSVTGTGSAGSAATGVQTVQGIASMVALKVDGSAVTQPISLASAIFKAASTAAVAADTSLVVALSPNTPGKIWDGTNTAAVKSSGTSAVTTDAALVVAISPNVLQTVQAFSLGSAISSTALVTTQALTTGAGIRFNGTLSGTVVTEISFDGTNWVTATMVDPVTLQQSTSAVFAGTSTANRSVIVPLGIAQIRVRVSVYTSGTLTGNIYLTPANCPQIGYETGAVGIPVPLGLSMLGGSDGTNAQALRATNASPAGTEYALITRPIISTVKAASTAPVAADTALVVAISPNSSLFTGGTTKNIVRGGAKGITVAADVTSVAVDSNTQALHVQLAGSTSQVTALPVVNVNAGTFTGTTQPVQLTGLNTVLGGSIGVFASGTFVGTVVAEVSYDGSTFVGTTFFNPTTLKQETSIVCSGVSSVGRSFALPPGVSAAQLRCSAFTSGSLGVALYYSANSGFIDLAWGAAGITVPPALSMLGASDGTNAQALRATNIAPVGTEYGLVTRNVFTESARATYSAVAVSFTAAASPTDVVTLTGSATKTIRVTKIVLSGVQTTSGHIVVNAVKRSTANTGGTSSSLTAVPHKSSSPAATATALLYSANPTLGTSVGTVKSSVLFVAVSTGSSASGVLSFDFGLNNDQTLTLSGTSEVLALNLNGTTVSGGTFWAEMHWIEE